MKRKRKSGQKYSAMAQTQNYKGEKLIGKSYVDNEGNIKHINKNSSKYDIYLYKYQDKQRKLRRKGKEMYKLPLTEAQFYSSLPSFYNEETIYLNQGDIKSRRDITDRIIQRQAYKVNYNTAKSLLKGLYYTKFQKGEIDELIENFSPAQIEKVRLEEDKEVLDFIKEINLEETDLLANYSKEEAKKKIESKYWGSP